MDGVWLVIAATDDRVLNARIKAEADARRILANVVDDPALSSFQVPAVVDRAPLTLAVSSGGAAPVIARRVRERLEALIDPALGALVRLAGEHRAAIRAAWPDHGARRCFYDWVHDGPVLEHLRAGDAEAARGLLRSRLDAAAGMPAPEPCVRRITPCPADPGQITLRQLRWLNEADVLIHDAPIREAVLSLARRDADRRCLDLGPDAPADVRETRIRALCAGYRNAVVLGAAVTPSRPGKRWTADHPAQQQETESNPHARVKHQK
jgi:uroporphyrin-III C-methyltransferase/precorrin-2 dehydrogenase/sirohydrochlorin ferrochelatase